MKNALISLASAAILFGSASAQQIISNPTQTIANFDLANVGPVLNELGIAWQSGKTETGQTYIAASAGNSVNFIMAPAACRDQQVSDCVGINMVAIFDGQANPQTVQAFNYRYAFASAGLDPSGSAYLSRYDICDYGIPRGNLATSIMVFVNQVVMFGNELDSARRTVSLEGTADDLSARYLNGRGLQALGVNIHDTSAPLDRHQNGLETGAVFVREFLRDKTVPRNKILNATAK